MHQPIVRNVAPNEIASIAKSDGPSLQVMSVASRSTPTIVGRYLRKLGQSSRRPDWRNCGRLIESQCESLRRRRAGKLFPSISLIEQVCHRATSRRVRENVLNAGSWCEGSIWNAAWRPNPRTSHDLTGIRRQPRLTTPSLPFAHPGLLGTIIPMRRWVRWHGGLGCQVRSVNDPGAGPCQP